MACQTIEDVSLKMSSDEAGTQRPATMTQMLLLDVSGRLAACRSIDVHTNGRMVID